MDKASKALRRSGVRIKSIGSGHSELQMVISQLKDVRVTSKAFATAQSSAMQDLVKWSLKDENRAIQDAVTQVGELFSIWTEVQREFSDHMKDFKHQFDMILEGARQLDIAKSTLQAAEQRETKLKKELKKVAKKTSAEELREMSLRLGEAEREKDIAQLEVVDRIREHEAIKLIRIKEGLFKVSEAYIDFAQKCDVIFGAQRDIALQIPDVSDRDIQDIKYTGSGATMQAVARAKDKIKRFRRRTSFQAGQSLREDVDDDLPPPYSENPPVNPFYNHQAAPLQPAAGGGGGGGGGPLHSSHNSSLGGGGGVVPSDHHHHHLSSSNTNISLNDSSSSNNPLLMPSAPGGPYSSSSAYSSDRNHYHHDDDHHHHPAAATTTTTSSPLSHPTLYPVLPDTGRSAYPPDCTPPYQVHDPWANVSHRQPLQRRNSYFSDAEDVAEAISSLNLSLNKR